MARRPHALLAFIAFLVVTALVRSSLAAVPGEGVHPASSLDRSTPRRALDGFLRAGGRGDFEQAEQFIDLRGVAKARQKKDGPDLAEKLFYVISHTPGFDLANVPDDPSFVPPASQPSLSVGTLYLGEEPIPLAMSRERVPGGGEGWLIARGTVAIAPQIYAAMGRYTWEDRMPDPLRAIVWGNTVWQWLALAAAIVASYFVSRMMGWLLGRIVRVFTGRTRGKADDFLVDRAQKPVRLMIALVVIHAARKFVRLTDDVDDVVDHVVLTLFIVACAWLATVGTQTVVRWVDERMPDESDSDLSLRRVRTQLAVFQRMARVFIVVIAGALALMQFAVIRSIGISILASAGLAGVVLGFAAQKSLGAMVAGLQLSLTQPIRIGDGIVIEGEYGTVEQILLTHVVVRLWDDRRMIVPVTRFLEQPFQNWTRTSSQLTGAVTLTCDFHMPVDLLRKELERICRAHALWDGRKCVLQVTDASERSMTVRALVTAANASAVWDLRCDVREKLVAFIAGLDGGRHLPRGREEWMPPVKDDGAAAAQSS